MAVSFVDYIADNTASVPRVMNMYAVVRSTREALGFKEPDNNEIIISQVEYVTQQYRKFVSSMRPAILESAKRGDAQALLDELIEQNKQLDTYPKDEKMALYLCIRDAWMEALINTILYWIQHDGMIEDDQVYMGGVLND